MDCSASENYSHPSKRRQNKNQWVRNKQKQQRYGPVGPPKSLTCNHGKKAAAYKCKEITKTDQHIFHKKFYCISGPASNLKMKQDSFILKYTDAHTPKKSRPVNNTKGEKQMSVRYFIFRPTMKTRIPVCQKAFLDTLQLSKNRVNGVLSRHFLSGEMPKENRGGDRKLKQFEAKRDSVISFIKSFTVIENHYCRSKTSNRLYLRSDLNIQKMWKIYDSKITDPDIKVKPSYFRHIFQTVFNIGFGSPRTDECSTCISLTERIKNNKNNHVAETALICEKRCHKLKAKAFYSLIKEKRDDLLTITFDCQKNQVLPKVPDQSAYYSRQLYKYNLTIVIGDSNSKQTKDNVFIYHWDESEHCKGPNEICSALYHCLTFIIIPEKVKVVRLASDGCGSQNKNYFMMGMISKWLLNNAPANVKNIEYLFPVVGHSFLPSDRVFAHIEKEIKKRDVIISPNEYTEIFSQFGTVIALSEKTCDWKTTVSSVLRPPGQWHFQFNPCKRFFFKANRKKDDIFIKGEVHYRSEIGQYKSVCKKNLKIMDLMSPIIVNPGVQVSQLKVRGVKALLTKHFGNDWKSLQTLSYYVNIVNRLKMLDETEHCPINQDENICENDCEIADLVV